MLDTVMELFWEKGYDDVSMEEIVKATGLNRYALYSRWGGKKDLYWASLVRYREMFLGTALAPLVNGEGGLSDIRAVFDGALALFDGPQSSRGCMMCRALSEGRGGDTDLGSLIENHFDSIGRLFGQALERAKARGEIAADADTEALADFLVGVIQGAQLFGRRNVDAKTVSHFFDGAIAALH